MFVKIFQVSADEEIRKEKGNLMSFRLKSVFKFVLARLASKEQNVLTPQPCLIHALMKTHLSANQSARTILVIL